jgi:hypothetical protein
MELLKSEFKTMVDLFESAQTDITISVPGITEEIAEALIQQTEKGIKLNVYIELDEIVYRYGFGDIKAIKIFEDHNVNVSNRKNFNVYFILIDNTGYFYFPKSRFIEKEGVSFDLFPMETSQVKRIKLLFNLLDEKEPDFEILVEEVGIAQLEAITQTLQKVESVKSKLLIEKLTADAPLAPDIGRTLETYKAKFQIVELKFKGANLHVKRIRLPNNALPFHDDMLKRMIEASLRLFYDIPEKEFLNPFFVLKSDLDLIRSKYLHHLKSREKNIISRNDLTAFKEEIDKLSEQIEKVKGSILNNLQAEIAGTREKIKENLIGFLRINIPDELAGLNDENLEIEIKNLVNGIVSRIRFPKAKDLLGEMKIEYHPYDITWEDLNNKEVLKELLEKKLIDKDEKAYIDQLAIAAKEEK